MVNDELISSRDIQPEDVETLEDAAAQDQEALAIGQAGETIVVTRPAPGQTVEIQTVPGQTYVLNFPPAEAQVQVEGDNFILGFDDNGDGTPDSQVVFLNLVNVAEAGEAPTFQIAGVDIGAEVLLGQALALAGQDDVPLDDVAAGPGAQGGGATQYSDNLGDIINLLNAEDVIPPTELQFGLIELEDEITIVAADDTLPEGEVAPPEVVLTLPVEVDCIEEDSGLSDPSNEVTLTVAPQGDDEIIEIVISGLQPGWSYDFSGLAVDGASLTDSDATDGSISLSVPNLTSYTGSFTVQPPADSDVDHPTITATATVVDPTDPTLSASGDGTLDVHVDANADGGEGSSGDDGDAEHLSVTIAAADSDDEGDTFEVGESGTVTVTATFDDYLDESETHKVTMTAPAGFIIAGISELSPLPPGVDFDLADDGSSISFTVPTDAVQGLGNLTVTLDVTNVSLEDGETAVFTAEAQAVETTTGDVECDPSDADNVATVEASVEVTANPAALPVLVVGENVDDDAGQTVDHRIQNPDGQPDGEVAGNNAGDVLIGDVGGGSLDGKTMNLVLVLDTSDSMEAEITFNGATMMRIEALDLAVEQLLDNLAGTEGATVRLHMVSFATDVKEVGTFNIIVNGVVDDAALQAAKDFVLGVGDNPLVVAEGNTNYEAGFHSALEWFSDDANTLDNPDFNKTIFISDGLPNRAYEGDSTTKTIVQGNTQSALNHVLGQVDLADDSKDDTISEFDGLLGTFEGVAGTVDAIGINVDTAGLAVLDQVDEGAADNITNGEELVEVLDDLTEVTQLAAVGSDVIVGNDGDDLIFGDTLFTDSLAGAEGITSVPGSGWSVIEQLIANGFFGADPEDVNQNIMDFLRDPANQELYDLGGESLADGGVGREGGHDSIDGGAGNDTIFAQEGNDTILGGNGDDLIIGGSGDDSMTGGDGSDTFRWTDATQDGEEDIIVGFETGTGGDVIDLAGLLTGVPAGPTATDLDDYLTFTSGGGNTTITIDFDGAGTGTDTSTITLQGVDLSGIGDNQAIITSLLADGNLVAEQA